MYAISWLIILVAMLVIEMISLGLTSIWFAGGALVAFIAAMLGLGLIPQIILFLLVSVGLLISTRPIAVKYFNKDRVRTNVESMIGREAIVTSEIDNLQGIGQVTVGGQEWSARCADEHGTLEVGLVVKVVAVSGVKLIVKKELEE